MIKVIRSYRRNNTYWKEANPLKFNEKTLPHQKLIVVKSDVTYQTHKGFGGAFTEASALTLNEMPKNEQTRVMKAYFSSEGLRYNMGRTVIHSSDFSQTSRTYIEDDDESLESFTMEEDDALITPMIQSALTLNPDLWLLSSPWSPPAFMKTNHDLYYGGKLKKEYYLTWAKYLVKYIEAMKTRGIKIRAITLQNEPEATQVWESCTYTAQEELEFAKALHPALEQAGLDTRIIIWDHNRDAAAERAHHILREIPDYIWGVGYHWYVTEDSDNLSVIHDLYPDKHILFTEGTVELTNTAQNSSGEAGELWTHGQFYGRNIIKDSLNYSEGFIDWNLFLNEIGGPNHVENYCEAPIMYDREKKEVIFNPSYYVIGHFSRYVEPGAKRIHINHTVDEHVFATAYKNPSGDIVIIIQNENWIRQFTMIVDGKSVDISLPEKSITTYIVEGS